MDVEETETPAPGCPFCHRDRLSIVLEQTPHFFLLVDHAPLVKGHLLLVPRAHYACYGAVPAGLDGEFAGLKARVVAFLRGAYGPVAFFEHGIFRQTVYHAHLHALPFGALAVDMEHLLAGGGRRVHSADDVRTWYAERGQYFYLEQPATGDRPGDAALFPPHEAQYRHVLGTLRAAAGRHTPFQPQPLRQATGRPKMRSLAEAWRAHTDTQ